MFSDASIKACRLFQCPLLVFVWPSYLVDGEVGNCQYVVLSHRHGFLSTPMIKYYMQVG